MPIPTSSPDAIHPFAVPAAPDMVRKAAPAVVVVGVSCSCVVAVVCPAATVTLDEENEHAYPAGKTVVPVGHVKLIVPVKPPDAVIVTVAIPALPATNATGFGDTLTLKSPDVIGWLAESAACQLLSPR